MDIVLGGVEGLTYPLGYPDARYERISIKGGIDKVSTDLETLYNC
jgi:hypothetical protein